MCSNVICKLILRIKCDFLITNKPATSKKCCRRRFRRLHHAKAIAGAAKNKAAPAATPPTVAPVLKALFPDLTLRSELLFHGHRESMLI